MVDISTMEEMTRARLLQLIEAYVADGNSWHALAIASGVNYTNLIDFKRGKANLPRDRNIAKLLSILHPQLHLAQDATQVPISGYMEDAGHVVFTQAPPSAAEGMKEPERRRSTPRIGALEVRSDNLAPFITKGFRLMYEERVHGVPEEYLDKLCIVQIADGPCVIKRIRKGTRVGRYHLLSLDPKEKPIENAAIEWSAFITHMVQG